MGLILQDCKGILVELSGCSLVHVRRTENKVTNALAKAASSSSCQGVWTEFPPPFLIRIVFERFPSMNSLVS